MPGQNPVGSPPYTVSHFEIHRLSDGRLALIEVRGDLDGRKRRLAFSNVEYEHEQFRQVCRAVAQFYKAPITDQSRSDVESDRQSILEAAEEARGSKVAQEDRLAALGDSDVADSLADMFTALSEQRWPQAQAHAAAVSAMNHTLVRIQSEQGQREARAHAAFHRKVLALDIDGVQELLEELAAMTRGEDAFFSVRIIEKARQLLDPLLDAEQPLEPSEDDS